MEIVCRTLGIISSKHQKKGIYNIKNARFDGISLELGKKMCDYNMIEDINFKIAYAPAYNDEDNYLDILEKSIQAAVEKKCNYIVIKAITENDDFFISIGENAKKNNIMILIENVGKDINGRYIRGEFSNSDTLCEYIDKLNGILNKEVFGLCLDTGMCMLCRNNIYSYVEKLGKRIKVIKIRECDSNNNASLIPFSNIYNGSASFDWIQLIHALRGIKFDSILLADIEETIKAVPPILEKDLLTYLKTLMDFFANQIKFELSIKEHEKVVIFGAGNIGQDFVKNFSDLYDIEFICDNNSNLWGENIKGIQIKSPNEIKSEYKVIICSTFYREIEQQLIDMGIDNVEFYL